MKTFENIVSPLDAGVAVNKALNSKNVPVRKQTGQAVFPPSHKFKSCPVNQTPGRRETTNIYIVYKTCKSKRNECRLPG